MPWIVGKIWSERADVQTAYFDTKKRQCDKVYFVPRDDSSHHKTVIHNVCVCVCVCVYVATNLDYLSK